MSESSNSKVKLKLLIDTESRKVLFAEASKDFVDFLFSLMALPLGQVIKLLTKSRMVGCLGNLYQSIESLSETYIESSQNVKFVLNPKAPIASFQNPLLLSSNNEFARGKKAYMCRQENPSNCHYCRNTITTCHPHVAENFKTPCPDCGNIMSYKLKLVESGSDNQLALEGGVGFVEGVITYMVMDDLEVKAMSTISSIALINSFNVKDLSSLQEQVVEVGVEEGLKLLQISLQSKEVLTSVFLRNQGP